MTTRLPLAAAVVAAALVAVSACAAGPSATGLVKEGRLTVCSDVPYAPFEQFDTESELGYQGFDIDLVEAIADRMDLELVVLDQDFDSLKSGLVLNARACDLAASAITITEDRRQNLEFTDGYYQSKQSLLVPAGSPVRTLADLRGRKVGVQRGSSGKEYAEQHARGAEVVSYPSDAEMFPALRAGQVDALLQDLPVNVEHAKGGEYVIAEEYATDEVYGFAARKGNVELVEKVDAELAELRRSGEYQEIYDSYFTAD